MSHKIIFAFFVAFIALLCKYSQLLRRLPTCFAGIAVFAAPLWWFCATDIPIRTYVYTLYLYVYMCAGAFYGQSICWKNVIAYLKVIKKVCCPHLPYFI